MMSSNRAEADRWLATAEKLLAARDLQGARTFAIRARESDMTRAELADRILAVSETLLSGENPVNNTHHHDWYAILRVVRLTQNLELLATQYRMLALLLNPTKNSLPFADQAFKLVSDAWYVLSNPSKKALYDHELQLSQLGQLGQLCQLNHPPLHHQQQQQQQQQLQHQPQQPPLQPLKQTPPQTVRKSPRKKDGKEAVEEERPNLNNEMESTPQIRSAEQTWKTRSTEPTWITRATEPTWKTRPSQAQSSIESGAASFWTACPYCYVMYEYQKMYEECTLRCQNCRRAFHAVMIPSPPLTGKDTYFCCWGLFPLGFSGNGKDTGGFFSNWSPVSTMFACPIQNASQDQNNNVGKPNNASASKKSAPPRVYYDDDDMYVDLSDSSDDDDDDEWENERRKKKGKYGKGKRSMARNAKKPQVERVKRGNLNVSGQVNVGSGNSGENMNGGSMVAGTSSGAAKVVGSSGRKQIGIGAKELGKLDLNVEFSNEVEEPASASRVSGGSGTGHGEEDNIEGIGFFEGLDEFLSSLPILSVVANDKVKAT